MRLAVVGTRTFDRVDVLTAYLDRQRTRHAVLAIVSGGARGADRLAADYARRHGLPLDLHRATGPPTVGAPARSAIDGSSTGPTRS